MTRPHSSEKERDGDRRKHRFIETDRGTDADIDPDSDTNTVVLEDLIPKVIIRVWVSGSPCWCRNVAVGVRVGAGARADDGVALEHLLKWRLGDGRVEGVGLSVNKRAELDQYREAAKAEKRMDTLRKKRRRVDQSSLHATVSKSWPHVWHQ